MVGDQKTQISGTNFVPKQKLQIMVGRQETKLVELPKLTFFLNGTILKFIHEFHISLT